MPDINKMALGELSDVQKAFLRRALGLSKWSLICALFTETGLDPLEFRRLDLTLGYWYYIVMCPSTRYVYQALVEAIQLDYDGHRSWVSDLCTAVAREVAELTFPAHPDLMKEDWVQQVREQLRENLNAKLLTQVKGSRRLYLLHGRLEPGAPDEEWLPVPCKLCHYLRVGNPGHRKALTRLLVADHCYRDEALRN
jgi:hypothetical protein